MIYFCDILFRLNDILFRLNDILFCEIRLDSVIFLLPRFGYDN